MREIKGTYREVREQLPEEVRHVLDHIVPPTANVNMVEMSNLSDKENDGCSFMGCSFMGCKSCDDCPIDKAMEGTIISPYIDCIDVELGELEDAVNYHGVVSADKKAAAISSLKQIVDAAMNAIAVLE